MSILSILSPVIGPVVDKILDFIPDPEAKAKAAAAAKAEIDQQVNALNDTNLAEAKSPSMFVAGARPALIWVCVLCFAIYYVPYFALGIVFWAEGCWKAGTLVARPDLGANDILNLLGALLGLSGLRTVEKVTGVDTKAIAPAKQK